MSISVSPQKRRISSDLIILFFLYEGGGYNPYQVKQYLKNHKITDWIPISMRTIYYTMERLEKEGLIIGEKQPFHSKYDKTQFKITKSGKSYLEEG